MTTTKTARARCDDCFIVAPDLDFGMCAEPGLRAITQFDWSAVRRRNRRTRERASSDLLTAQQAADCLGISIKTLRGHVASGALRYISIGHGHCRPRKMFAPADVQTFIEAQSRKDQPCPSIATNARRSTATTSSSEVIGFTARRNARIAAKLKK